MRRVSYDSFSFYYPETKEMINDSVNLKGVVYSQNKALSAFSLLPIPQVLQTLARYFIKLIQMGSEQVLIELHRKTC